jgi:AcrR family transcriptional regulator
MGRTGNTEVGLNRVLYEAGLSTGAFYRHFASKDDLLLDVYLYHATRAAQRITERVERSSSCLEGLEEWIDEVLSWAYEAPKRKRVATLGSQAARRTAGYSRAQRESSHLIAASLVAVLKEGKADGSFPATDPENDAPAICAITFSLLERKMAGTILLDRAQARNHVLRFCAHALQGPID